MKTILITAKYRMLACLFLMVYLAGCSKSNQLSKSIIFEYINNGDLESVKEYVAGGGGLLVIDQSGYTPLMLSIVKGKKDISKYLLSVKRIEDETMPALHLKSRSTIGETPLSLAIIANDLKTTKLILDEFPQVLHVSDTYYSSPIHLACLKKKRIEVLKLLINELPHTWFKSFNQQGTKNDSVEASVLNWQVGPNGFTPLHAAVSSNNIEAVQLLLKAGATPSIRIEDFNKNTVFDIAKKKKYVEILQELDNWNPNPKGTTEAKTEAGKDKK